jgi:hypothetical protein
MTDNLIDTIEYYLNHRYPNRENLVKGVSISLIATIAGNSVKTDLTCPIQTRSNMYVLLCAPSGVGKTTIRNYGLDILTSISYKNLMPDDITTEAIPRYLYHHPHALMTIEELSGMLGSYKKKAYLAGMVGALIKMYDGAPLTQGRSTRESIEARNYAMNVIADIQPRLLSQTADENDVQSGFIPRFFIYHQKDSRRIAPVTMNQFQINLRAKIIDQCKSLYTTLLHNNIDFVFTPQQIETIFDKLKNYTTTDLVHFEPIYTRVNTIVYKLAMLRRIADLNFIEGLKQSKDTDAWELEKYSRINKKINMDDRSVEWAIDYCIDYCKNSIPETLKILELSDADKIKHSISEYIDKHSSPMPESLLYRSVIYSLKDVQRIENAIKLATKMKLIKRESVQGGHRYRVYTQKDEERELSDDVWGEHDYS